MPDCFQDVKSAGERIAAMRRERGWSQQELGRRIGVSKQQVMRYEVHGMQNMRVRRLVALCRALGCSADGLLGIDAERTDRKGGRNGS